jgi:hypothetical protein
MSQYEVPPEGYDTMLCDRLASQYRAEKVGIDRLVIGSDHPFRVKRDRLAQSGEQALGIARETRSTIARRLLAPDDALAAQRG